MLNISIMLIGLALVVAGVISLSLSKLRVSQGRSQKVHKSLAILIIVGVLVVIAGNSFTVVPTGYTGVRTTFGLIDQESCMPGFNILTPFVQDISLVNNKQQDIRIGEQVWSETEEQVVVYMEGTVVTYQIVPESSAWIYANVENWVEELIDADIVSSALKTASRTLKADTVTDRGVIEPLTMKTLQQSVDEKYGPGRVIIKNIVISNIDFEDSYNKAIAEKSNALQDQQRQAILNQTNVDKAKAEAEADRERARGQADAELILAEGKANAAREIAGAITEATQRQDAIDKWDGSLPRYMGGTGDTFGILDAGDQTVSTPASTGGAGDD